MQNYIIKENMIGAYRQYLHEEERASGTIEKYVRDVKRFATWLDGRCVTKEMTAEWKEHLLTLNYCPSTINSMLASVHGFYQFAGWENCRTRFLRIQRQIFREQKKELGKTDYKRLISTAKSKKQDRLAMIIETIGATGIRVSELKYLTVEAVRQGQAVVSMKGKIRTILLPGKLIQKLLAYAKKKKITSGEIFLTRNGTSVSRKQIWAEMKRLCKAAGVAATKVFPHNLRHLFARIFYKSSKDIVRLADVLGHSSIETTRIYLVTSGLEYQAWLDQLRLVI
ncbi:MAG: tyrosine-type recombinase/integrase [Lachnospiraceae bacterium]|nr:tyrosine-type recombinase/integrase [Lachnospiraceae bacterium]